MKLKTSLQLSAIFPIAFAIVMALTARWWMDSGEKSEALTTVFLALTGVLGLSMTAVILTYSKDIVSKIKILNEWTDAVLKGDLEAQVNLNPLDVDEVSKLSYALSRMLREIKQAYSQIHKESGEHKRMADAAQIGTKHLSEALNRMKDSQQETMQNERLHVYEQVIRGVVHDFGESLTPIQGTVDMLLAHPETMPSDSEMLQHLNTMSEAVQNAGRSLKNLAGIYHTPVEHSLGPSDINSLIERSLLLLSPRWKAEANASGIHIDVSSSLQSVPSVVGDPSDIQDLITNLIMNAVEAMPQGGKILVSTHADKSSVTLEVRDTGRGMTKEVRQRCLEPFFTTKASSGTGMGLMIVNGVVHRYRGSLTIESEPGKGTSVFVQLPIWSEAFRERAPSEPAEAAARPLSVLLVDDDELSLKVLSRILTGSGYAVTTASNGLDGLEKIKKSRFDAAIVDRAMPGMDGVALARSIKEVSPKTPVIMLTGYADIMREERDVPNGIDLLLSKPSTLADLRKALSSVIGQEVDAKAKQRPDGAPEPDATAAWNWKH